MFSTCDIFWLFNTNLIFICFINLSFVKCHIFCVKTSGKIKFLFLERNYRIHHRLSEICTIRNSCKCTRAIVVQFVYYLIPLIVRNVMCEICIKPYLYCKSGFNNKYAMRVRVFFLELILVLIKRRWVRKLRLQTSGIRARETSGDKY